jgi:predicted Holliday junction resolvase-like endonuclease
MNLVAFMQEQKRILGICPCCGELFRLSDAALFTRQAPPPTPLDEVDAERRKAELAEQKFDEKAEALREAALRRGQAEARQRLRSIARPFVERDIDPQDVKVLFDPVEFVAFRGMAAGAVSAVVLIDRPAADAQHEALQRSVADAVEKGRYEWKVLRIDDGGRVEIDRQHAVRRARPARPSNDIEP